MNVFVPFRRHSLNTVELRRSSKLPGWVTYVIIRRQTTSNRVEKSSPAHGHGKQTLTPSNCNKLSSHCRSDYFGSTKIVSSNSFGQNKIGHEFCLPKLIPATSRCQWKTNLLCSKLATCTKASESIDSGQFGLKQHKTRIPRCSSSTATSKFTSS